MKNRTIFQQWRLRVNEICRNPCMRPYPERIGTRQERQSDTGENSRNQRASMISKCKFGTLELHFGIGENF